MDTKSRWRSFEGTQGVYVHDSEATGTRMEFSVFLPPQAESRTCPVVWYLSGLTCTWENATVKAGFQRVAAELGLIVVAPDTSPRGEGVPDDPDGAYDFGLGAGFYVNATEEPFSRNYRMYDYVVDELPSLVAREFPAADGPAGIMGHSMGGHGALTIAMRNPDRYASLSAFSPIVAPTQVPWGQNALEGYLGADESAWQDHDACLLVRSRGWHGDILVDQGEADEFLAGQLRTALFVEACAAAGVPLTVNMRPGYDHSYYFISTFMEDHLRWHAARLGAAG